MKERPISFQEWKVKKILEWDWSQGNMQTRRVIKPPNWSTGNWGDFELMIDGIPMIIASKTGCLTTMHCPYGQPGDRLWVREAFLIDWEYGEGTRGGISPLIYYKATDVETPWTKPKWTSSRFMPRIASRIMLEVIKVRAERLQEMDWHDVIPEGIGSFTLARGVLSDTPPDPRWKFIELWNSINAKRGFGWDVNPWVWVIEFKMVEVKG